jgi:hypothetical protein
MKRFSRYRRLTISLLALVASLCLIVCLGDSGLLDQGSAQAKITPDTVVSESPLLDRANPQVQAVMAVQNRHTPHLMALPEVVGTATGATDTGQPAVIVFTHKEVGHGILPAELDGVPVVVKVTGKIFALAKPVKIDPTQRFTRPAPIGVSTGNQGECSAGTISARVKQGSAVYALSNNHVYALENTAQIGSKVLQPGLYDTKCKFNSNNVIGTLFAFEPIVFSDTANNTIDAAIAATTTANVGNSTPPNGYGIPNSTTASASVGMHVQKYGRTTSLTKGSVYAINANVLVQYSSGVAQFNDQIVVTSGTPFIKPGDSGSLLVTDDAAAHPVGLLFAGNGSGNFAWANEIDQVLGTLGVVIDGKK